MNGLILKDHGMNREISLNKTVIFSRTILHCAEYVFKTSYWEISG